MKRSRVLPAVGAACAALLAVGTFATSADATHGNHSSLPRAHSGHHAAIHAVSPAKKHGNCYSNLHNDTGIGIVSQNFTDAGYDIYDSYGAVPFAVAKPCFVDLVYAPGAYFNGSGPADSETVTFYADNGGQPGAVIDSQTVVGADNFGTFTIPIVPTRIPAGPAWVSVVANMSFTVGGEWGWELSSNNKNHANSDWENPGNGLSTGCTTWQPVQNCVGYGNSFMVQLVKQYQQ